MRNRRSPINRINHINPGKSKKIALCLFLVFVTLAASLFTSCGNTPQSGVDTQSGTKDTVPTLDVPLDTFERPAPETEAEPEEIFSASFVACGDNIIYYGNVRDAAALAVPNGRKYNFMPTYSEVADYIASADISYINQETVMAGDGFELSYYPRFNSPQDLAYDLCDTGFDVINIANNHMLDVGGAGLSATINFWKTMPVTLIGRNSDIDDYNNIKIVEKNGVRVAFLSYCEMTNGMTIGKDYDIYIPYLSEADFKAQVNSVKDKCDFIIASVHWGDEGSFTPNEKQKDYAKQLSDAGVDVIIGHHPHVIQPIEWIKGEGGNETLCVYSLGNFAAEQAYSYNMVGGFISFDIVKSGDSHAVCENAVFEPTVFHFPSNFYNNKVYFLRDYTEEMAQSHGVRTYYSHSIDLATLKGYVTSTISSEFLPDYLK